MQFSTNFRRKILQGNSKGPRWGKPKRNPCAARMGPIWPTVVVFFETLGRLAIRTMQGVSKLHCTELHNGRRKTFEYAPTLRSDSEASQQRRLERLQDSMDELFLKGTRRPFPQCRHGIPKEILERSIIALMAFPSHPHTRVTHP
jgi:hypothetical protein